MNKAFEETWKRAGWPDEVKYVYRTAFKTGMLHAAEIVREIAKTAIETIELEQADRTIRKAAEEEI